jgi:hypothetical protein
MMDGERHGRGTYLLTIHLKASYEMQIQPSSCSCFLLPIHSLVYSNSP